MMYNNLSRDQVIEIVGLDAVESAETTNAVQTGTLRRDGQVEFKSCFVCKDKNGDKCEVSAIWLMDADDVHRVNDLSDLDWDDCNHYIVD
jgi:5-methylcytosine-specific restriction endonuclease McrA